MFPPIHYCVSGCIDEKELENLAKMRMISSDISCFFVKCTGSVELFYIYRCLRKNRALQSLYSSYFSRCNKTVSIYVLVVLSVNTSPRLSHNAFKYIVPWFK